MVIVIPSPNPDAPFQETPSENIQYPHGLNSGKTGVPMMFQITSPFSRYRVLLPHALMLHVNPNSLQEQHTKRLERIQTRGGWVEQHWGDDLTSISCSGSTGGFINVQTGLSSVLRKQTIAWNRYWDLLSLYRGNGSVYNPDGAIVLQGSVMLQYDRGSFLGWFESFSVEETEDQPFMFNLSWTFKVEEEWRALPSDGS